MKYIFHPWEIIQMIILIFLKIKNLISTIQFSLIERELDEKLIDMGIKIYP